MRSALIWVIGLLTIAGGWMVARGLDVEAHAPVGPVGWTAYAPLSESAAYQSNLYLTYDDPYWGSPPPDIPVAGEITNDSSFTQVAGVEGAATMINIDAIPGLVRILPDPATVAAQAPNAFERIMVDLGLVLLGLAVIALVAQLTLRARMRESRTPPAPATNA